MIRDSMEYAMDDFNQRNLVEFRAKTEMIFQGLDKVWDKVPDYLDRDQILAIQEHRQIMADIAKGTNAMELKAAIDKMGDLTRDLADSIMGDAARQEINLKDH